MFDIKKIEAEAQKEIAEEQATTAKRLIKAKLAQIAAAEKVTANLRSEYAVLLKDIGGLMFDGPRILSRPWVIHWAGWKTDTYRLQQSGWSLSAQQDINYGSLRIAMKHEQCQLYGLTSTIDHDYYENIRDPHDTPRQELHVVHMASRFIVNIHETPSVTAFAPIDAKPCFSERKIVTMDDLAHFAPPLVRTKEIILPEENVPELLERILKLQQPDRTARLKAELAADRTGTTRDPQQRFHAQILSIAA